MSESELSSYQLQLQQVEAALTSDPANSELLKLKADLEQVIDLTKQLVSQSVAKAGSQPEEAEEEEPPAPSSSSSGAVAGTKRKFHEEFTPVKHWQVGEQCQALWHKDGNYYEATVSEITTDGDVQVKFRHNGQSGVTSLGLLKISKHGISGTKTSTSRKEQQEREREHAKRRKQKKLERFKNLEKEGEKGKNKWQNFSNKAFGKKGFVKKSIFKTPENAKGRVGIGTCGAGGKDMTEFDIRTKHNKRV